MKNRQATLKVLLDTSFILPSLGIDTGEAVLKSLRKLDEVKAEIYYSSFSLLESLWVAARLANTTFDRERFSLGLRSIIEREKYVKVEEDSKTLNDALTLYMQGHKDMVDNILYASSTNLNLKLLTLDNELKEFINKRKLTNPLISPSQIT